MFDNRLESDIACAVFKGILTIAVFHNHDTMDHNLNHMQEALTQLQLRGLLSHRPPRPAVRQQQTKLAKIVTIHPVNEDWQEVMVSVLRTRKATSRNQSITSLARETFLCVVTIAFLEGGHISWATRRWAVVYQYGALSIQGMRTTLNDHLFCFFCASSWFCLHIKGVAGSGQLSL